VFRVLHRAGPFSGFTFFVSKESIMSTTLTKAEPRAVRSWAPFQAVRDEIEDLWSRVTGDTEGWLMPRMSPALDLTETPTTVEVRVDLPGIKAEELDIQLANNILTIRGERKEEKVEKSETMHRIERRTGSFSRSITLPASVLEDKVDARCKDGVLTISLQKTDNAKSKKITVKG
jgi:HSP20 family protein